MEYDIRKMSELQIVDFLEKKGEKYLKNIKRISEGRIRTNANKKALHIPDPISN
jgi:hypothetical protein